MDNIIHSPTTSTVESKTIETQTDHLDKKVMATNTSVVILIIGITSIILYEYQIFY